MPTDGIQSDRSNLGEGVSWADLSVWSDVVVLAVWLSVVEARGGPLGPIFPLIIFIPACPLSPQAASENSITLGPRGAVLPQVPYAIYVMSARAKRTRTSRLEMLNHSQFKAWPSTLIDPMGRVMSQGS